MNNSTHSTKVTRAKNPRHFWFLIFDPKKICSKVLDDGSVVHINKTTISDTDEDGNRSDLCCKFSSTSRLHLTMER